MEIGTYYILNVNSKLASDCYVTGKCCKKI